MKLTAKKINFSCLLRTFALLFSLLFSADCLLAKESSSESSTTQNSPIPVQIEQESTVDFSKENMAFDVFWKQEANDLTLEQLIKKFEEDNVFANTASELTLSCKSYVYHAPDGTTTPHLRFCELPKDIQMNLKKQHLVSFILHLKRAAIAEEVQGLIDRMTKPEEKKPVATSSWHGLTIGDLITLIPICYISGRQVRDAGVPGKDELVSLTGPFKIIGDIALGYLSNIVATICHEAGHSITYRALYGKWPEQFVIGTNDTDAPALISLRNGAIALRGLNPCNGYVKAPVELQEARSIPVLAAGGICGIAGYYGFKRLVHNILGKKLRSSDEHWKELANSWADAENKVYKIFGYIGNANEQTLDQRIRNNPHLVLTLLPLIVDISVLIQLQNVLLSHEIQGLDANGIVIAIGHQFNKAWDRITAKFKHKKSRTEKK